MSSWFVRPETATLQLSEGQTLTVRKRLNMGEWRAARKRMADPVDATVALATAYLLDWSLPDVSIHGISVDDLTATLENLDPARFQEIVDAINRHVEAVDAEKKRMATTPAADPISPLPSDVAGGSNGSGNLTQTTTTPW